MVKKENETKLTENKVVNSTVFCKLMVLAPTVNRRLKKYLLMRSDIHGSLWARLLKRRAKGNIAGAAAPATAAELLLGVAAQDARFSAAVGGKREALFPSRVADLTLRY